MERERRRRPLRERDRLRVVSYQAAVRGMDDDDDVQLGAAAFGGDAHGGDAHGRGGAALNAAEERAALLAEQAALAALIAQLETGVRLLRARQAHIVTVLAAGRTV